MALLCLLLSSCAHQRYDPRPVSLDGIASQIEAHSLDSPELRAFVQAHYPDKAWPPAQWDLDALTLVAFFYNPDLQAARARLASADAAQITAAQRPNPVLGLSSQRTLNQMAGISPWTLGLLLDIPIETAGKRGYRMGEAAQLAQSAQLQLAGAAWDVRSQLRTQLLALWSLSGKAQLVRRQAELEQTLSTMLEKRLAEGYASAWELNQQRLAALQSTRDALAAERDALAARVKLAAILGLKADAFAHAQLDLAAFDRQTPEPPAQAIRRQALLGRADVRSGLAQYEASQAALQREVAKQYPDLHLGPAYTFDQGADKLGFDLSNIELPIFNRNEGPIAEARARRQEAEAKVRQLEAKAFFDADSALVAYHGAHAIFQQAATQLAVQRRQLGVAGRALELGADDRMALVLAEKAELAARLAQFDATFQVQQALGQIEDAMQLPLTSTMIPLPPNPPAK
ncbi:TolC family protein [Massilia horti]|uniref:TolC family protein n=1 Tax=Massilia horti TaxID=2562153 RepID=UPI001430C814|nr:TolC family protein [Massilia horti]